MRAANCARARSSSIPDTRRACAGAASPAIQSDLPAIPHRLERTNRVFHPRRIAAQPRALVAHARERRRGSALRRDRCRALELAGIALAQTNRTPKLELEH